MWKNLRRIVGTVALLALLGVLTPAAARADVDMNDYNTYWQVANSPAPPNPSLEYNTYWAEVQAQQQSGPNR
jgi:hypothetical protein